jgi:hypothetical protein
MLRPLYPIMSKSKVEILGVLAIIGCLFGRISPEKTPNDAPGNAVMPHTTRQDGHVENRQSWWRNYITP